MRNAVHRLLVGILLLAPAAAWGSHPLITDDAGTQGKGKFQLELSGQYDTEKETLGGVAVKSTGGQVAATLAYGFIENADVVVSLPHSWGKVKEDGATLYDERGVSDTTVEVKWRFFDNDGLSLALKPGLRIPTGNDAKGLGAGRTGYQAFIIGSKEVEPWAFHLNVGYIGNENRADEEKSIWHASVAATREVIKNLKMVGNVGIERNRDKTAAGNPAFLIGGLIYAFSERLDIDAGVKYGLTAAETDWSVMAGVAFRF